MELRLYCGKREIQRRRRRFSCKWTTTVNCSIDGRHGVGASEMADSPLPASAVHVWTVRRSASEEYDAYIVVAFASSTLVLSIGMLGLMNGCVAVFTFSENIEISIGVGRFARLEVSLCCVVLFFLISYVGFLYTNR